MANNINHITLTDAQIKRINLMTELNKKRGERSNNTCSMITCSNNLNSANKRLWYRKHKLAEAREKKVDDKIEYWTKKVRSANYLKMVAENEFNALTQEKESIKCDIKAIENQLLAKDLYLTKEEESRLVRIYQNESKHLKFRLAARDKLFKSIERVVAKIYYNNVAPKYNFQIQYREATPVIMEAFQNAIQTYKPGSCKFISYFATYVKHIRLEDHFRYAENAEDAEKKCSARIEYQETVNAYNFHEQVKKRILQGVIIRLKNKATPIQKKVIEARLQEKTYAEIGKSLNVSDESARLWATQGLKDLAKSCGLTKADALGTIESVGHDVGSPRCTCNFE